MSTHTIQASNNEKGNAAKSSKPTSNWLSRISLWLMILSSVAIGLYAFAFQAGMQGDPDTHARFAEWPVFWSKLRRDHINIHRWLGRIYLAFVLVGGVGGLVLSPNSDGGLVAHFGFGMLAVLWLFSGWQAYASIRRGDIASHKAWMMRNFSMTFGAVMLRVYLGLFAVAGVDFVDSYPTVAWIAWVPNLILVEWYLAFKSAKQKPQGNVNAA